MGITVDSQVGGGGGGCGCGSSSWGGFKSLVRRKQVDSAHAKRGALLAKELSVPYLVAIGNFFFYFHGDIDFVLCS